MHILFGVLMLLTNRLTLCRTYGLVPEVRIRGEPLAPKGDRARARLRPVQPRMFQPLPGLRHHGRQRYEALHYATYRGTPLCAV